MQRFLADFQFSEQAELTLADFNQETLDHVTRAIRKIKDRLSLGTSVQVSEKERLPNTQGKPGETRHQAGI